MFNNQLSVTDIFISKDIYTVGHVHNENERVQAAQAAVQIRSAQYGLL
jgi:hypothetical protein